MKMSDFLLDFPSPLRTDATVEFIFNEINYPILLFDIDNDGEVVTSQYALQERRTQMSQMHALENL